MKKISNSECVEVCKLMVYKEQIILCFKLKGKEFAVPLEYLKAVCNWIKEDEEGFYEELLSSC